MDQYVIGVDFGTDSVRSIIVNATNGNEDASSVFYYPRWKQGLFCNPSQQRFRQHPLDYIEGLEATIKQCIQQTGPDIASRIRGISIDTTGSTPVAADESGTPLALHPEFAENPNAMFILWKDHTSVREAEEINRANQDSTIDFLQFVGGKYSSEWYWAKMLYTLRSDKKVNGAFYCFIEHCDWIPFLLTGGTDVKKMKWSVCAAGHKALWSEHFGGFPSNNFFTSIDPVLDGVVSRMPDKTYSANEPAGTISKEWSKRLGLPEDIIVGVGAFDAHMGAVGGQIQPYYLSKVMGTSTCDMLVAPVDDIGNNKIKGICGQVNGSIIPGMIGLEAGQSAFGDVYAWFKNLLIWPVQHLLQNDSSIDDFTKHKLVESIEQRIIPELSKLAMQLPVEEDAELALDWLNGRRTPDASQLVKGGIVGLNLASDAVRIFRALAEATCFGAKKIVDRFIEQGIEVKGLIGIGGVARKSPYIMQMMADVMNMPIQIHKSEQTCAAGAAMFAATASGIYPVVNVAMEKMGRGFDMEYKPSPEKVKVYEKRYEQYKKLGDFTEEEFYSASLIKDSVVIV
ncbi:MAG TPA: ribulokinase [Flavitalea sp.]|nr:ribulokinase [Flavitalea sp.]